MHCDTCNKQLTENDTHESILCTSCMDAAEKIHCVRCHCITRVHKLYARFVEYMKKRNKILLVLGVVVAIIGCIALRWPLVAFKLSLGLVGIPTAIALFVGVCYVLFPLTYRFGSWINNKLGMDIEDIDRGPGGCFRWLLGIVAYTFPFIFYGAGILIFNMFFRK
jgi:hypothetical protein